MKVALIVIGRLENRYAVEFIGYYKKLGIDTIFIVDNNNHDEEWFEEVLSDEYRQKNSINIIHYRGHQDILNFQIDTYVKIYNKFKDKFDWFMFLDFDEFLTLTEDKNIKDYLSRDCFNNYNQILINWKIYTDNNLIYDDGRPCLERFTMPMDIYKNIEYRNIPENMHVKSIIRGNIDNINMGNPHYVYNDLLNKTTCNNCGEKINDENVSTCQPINYKLAYIKHFTTKTIDEWLNNKLKRGVGDRNYDLFLCTYPIERFFKYNDVTIEKIQYLKNKGIEIDLNFIENWFIDN